MREMNGRYNDEDEKVRNLIERGDMGYKPGGKFPYVDASTEDQRQKIKGRRRGVVN